MTRPPLPLSYLKANLRYDPETGDFWWIKKRNGVRMDRPAGTLNLKGRWVIKIDGKTYQASNLAWFYMTGYWPELEIDHNDKAKTNNRWTNLREATRSENMGNSPVQARSRTGIKGVTVHSQSGKFVANIRVNYKLIYLGIYETKEEAGRAYEQAALKYFGGFA